MTNGLYQMLLGQHAESTAPLLHLPDGKTLSYADMARDVAQISGLLRARGLRKGDRLAMQGPKSPRALALYLACVHSGVIFLPLNTAYTPDEVRYFVDDAAPKIIVTDPEAEAALRGVARDADSTLLTLDADGRGSFADAVAGAEPQSDAVPCSRRTDLLSVYIRHHRPVQRGDADAAESDLERSHADADMAVYP